MTDERPEEEKAGAAIAGETPPAGADVIDLEAARRRRDARPVERALLVRWRADAAALADELEAELDAYQSPAGGMGMEDHNDLRRLDAAFQAAADAVRDLDMVLALPDRDLTTETLDYLGIEEPHALVGRALDPDADEEG